MARISYEPSVLDAVIRLAVSARQAGKTWHGAFLDVKRAGYQGSASSLQKLVRAHPLGGQANQKPSPKKEQPAGYKNSAKTSESAAAGANAFSKSLRVSSSIAAAADTKSNAETLDSIQNRLPVLRDGTHYVRPISLFQGSFRNYGIGEIVAWSRILEKQEAVCVVNSHDQYPRGADVLVDSELNPPGSALTVIHIAAEHAEPGALAVYAVGSQIPVQRRNDGTAFIAIRDIAPAATLVLSNAPQVMARA